MRCASIIIACPTFGLPDHLLVVLEWDGFQSPTQRQVVHHRPEMAIARLRWSDHNVGISLGRDFLLN